MGKVKFKPDPKVFDVFDQLEKYREFCREYGHFYNESDLNNYKCHSWHQYQKYVAGKPCRDRWEEDRKSMYYTKKR